MVRILLVDDDVLMLRAYQNVLRDTDIKIDIASTLDEAQTLLKDSQYNVVVTDLRLTPQLKREGLEIIRLIKEMNLQTKVILVTGYGNYDVMNQAYQMGASFYLEKPISREVFLSALASLGVL